MQRVRKWPQCLHCYAELVGIECKNFNPDIIKITEQMFLPDLRMCPYEITGTTMILPKQATHFLSLRDIEHTIKKVEKGAVHTQGGCRK